MNALFCDEKYRNVRDLVIAQLDLGSFNTLARLNKRCAAVAAQCAEAKLETCSMYVDKINRGVRSVYRLLLLRRRIRHGPAFVMRDNKITRMHYRGGRLHGPYEAYETSDGSSTLNIDVDCFDAAGLTLVESKHYVNGAIEGQAIIHKGPDGCKIVRRYSRGLLHGPLTTYGQNKEIVFSADFRYGELVNVDFVVLPDGRQIDNPRSRQLTPNIHFVMEHNGFMHVINHGVVTSLTFLNLS